MQGERMLLGLEHRASSAALRGIRKTGGYAALVYLLECSGRGCAQARAAAVYRFTVESDRLKCSAMAEIPTQFLVALLERWIERKKPREDGREL
jgi:hypothetical protein